jgi:hypothetical protein
MSMLPRTREEWQDAVDMAEGARLVVAARAYGLVRGGPEINVDRCEEILRLGRDYGVRPGHDCHKKFVAACNDARRA